MQDHWCASFHPRSANANTSVLIAQPVAQRIINGPSLETIVPHRLSMMPHVSQCIAWNICWITVSSLSDEVLLIAGPRLPLSYPRTSAIRHAHHRLTIDASHAKRSASRHLPSYSASTSGVSTPTIWRTGRPCRTSSRG